MGKPHKKKSFAEKSEKERMALKEFLPTVLLNTDIIIYEFYYTDSRDYSHYDCLVRKYENARLHSTFIFEAKIHEADDDVLLLDKEKLDTLKDEIKEANTYLFYANFTPKRTVIFNLLPLERRGNIEYAEEEGMMMAHLDVNDGTEYDYVFGTETKKVVKKKTHPKKGVTHHTGLIEYGKDVNERMMLEAINRTIGKLLKKDEKKTEMLKKHDDDPVKLVNWLRARDYKRIKKVKQKTKAKK